MTDAAKAPADQAGSGKVLQAVGQSARIVAIALASLALAFGGWLLITSQAVVGDAHKRNWQDLEVLTSALETWPRDLGTVAKGARKFSTAKGPESAKKTATKRHPDLGLITFDYAKCAKFVKDSRLFEPGTVAGEGNGLRVIGAMDAPASPPVDCFSTRIELDRLLPIERQAPGFAALLIVNGDAEVVEQVGRPRLPVTTLGPLVPVTVFAKETVEVVGGVEKPVAASETTKLGANPGVVKVTIADVDYLAYVRPFTLRGPRAACQVTRPDAEPAKPAPAAAKAPAGPQSSPADVSIDSPCPLFAVGLMPATRLRHAYLSPPTMLLGGFGLTVLLLVALLPLARLLLIGGAEYASRPQIIALVFGLHVAVAVATLGALFAYELAGERQGAREEAVHSAQKLAGQVGGEVGGLIDAGIACENDGKSIKAPFAKPPSRPYLAGRFQGDGTLDLKNTEHCDAKAISVGTNVGARQYFQDLKQAPLQSNRVAGDQSIRYAIGAVRAQTDGLDQVALAIAAKPAGASAKPSTTTAKAKVPAGSAPDEPAQKAQPPPSKDDKSRVLVVSTILSSLLRPVLPEPERFMVVDAGQPTLPVLFHSVTARAGVESLTRQADLSRSEVAALGSLTVGHPDRQRSFTTVYEGRNTVFVAKGIPGTRWVLLVFYALDDVDTIAGWTAARALSSWAALFVPAMLIGFGLLLAYKGRLRRLWPFEAAKELYRDGARNFVAVALVIAALALAPPPIGLLALIVALGLSIVTGRIAAILKQPLECKALTVDTERRYRRFVLAGLLCISAAPMTVFWADARIFSTERVEAERLDGFKQSLAKQGSARQAITDATDGWFKPLVLPPIQLAKDSWQAAAPQQTFSRRVWNQLSGIAPEGVPHCSGPDRWLPSFCWKRTASEQVELDTLGIKPHTLAVPSKLGLTTVALITAALLFLAWLAVYYGFWSLTGFGIPLGAVHWPKLTIAGEADFGKRQMPLARTTVLVAPQRVVRNAIEADAECINLADQLFARSDEEMEKSAESGKPLAIKSQGSEGVDDQGVKKRLVVSGLELVIRDPDRRRVALRYLEQAISELSKPGKPGKYEKLVVIAEMSPLERIIDAYETQGEVDIKGSRAREQWRWARLFQGFTTFSFDPINKLEPAEVETRWPDPGNPVRILAEEMGWLPGNVIDGAIASSNAMPLKPDLYPHDDAVYREHYSKTIMAWAGSINPATCAAAIDFLRSNLIEHYEQCWLASSLAERVVLDALARDGFVNMRKAVALQSLVRRGLVILDPAPRLMNRSFALFIRQVERPETIDNWRAKQPRSAWSLAQVPLVIILPAVLVAFVVAAVESGQQLTQLVPLLAAGAPALLGLVMRSSRGTTGS